MLDLTEISNTISELEDGNTTFDTCQKLANLYTVLDHFNLSTSEPREILLPNYPKYCELKGKYQMGELSSAPVLTSLSALCLDMQKFVLTLYSTTDMDDERALIFKTLNNTIKTIETRK